MGGAEKELKLGSSGELLVSFVCGQVQNVADFGNGPHSTGRLSDKRTCEVLYVQSSYGARPIVLFIGYSGLFP